MYALVIGKKSLVMLVNSCLRIRNFDSLFLPLRQTLYLSRMSLPIKAYIGISSGRSRQPTCIMCLLSKASTIATYSDMDIMPAPVAMFAKPANLSSSSSAIEGGIIVFEAAKSMCASISRLIFPTILILTTGRLSFYGIFIRTT